MRTRSTPPPKIATPAAAPLSVQSSADPAAGPLAETPLAPQASVHRSDGTAAAERARGGAGGTMVGPETLHALDARTVRFLEDLAGKVPARIVDLLREDLDIAGNEDRLRASVERRYAKPWERERIFRALDVAKAAHEGQTQKRKSEASGLDHVPYANHPIRIATWAAELGLSADAVQAALLHDVVEDTKVDLAALRRDFTPAVLEMVDALTKKKTESRAHYLAHVAAMTGEASAIKCLDRIHNLLRGFSTRDPAYLARYLEETRTIYAPKMATQPEVAGLRGLFDGLVSDLDAYRAKLA